MRRSVTESLLLVTMLYFVMPNFVFALFMMSNSQFV
ncbi:Uncharacterised protein [Klebsiella pneumoniae]|nr:Uncharacterised protein [Klebsiella pneumoniae]SVQ26772.1 Uncharacterised protein [Klebsiella pneumoniae]SVQ61919.1 Uncharacterised protein [Klebsiella pneumoniae]SVQ69195.1 Uncharacterised protein [Klebsiella pneumoniae]SVQ83832.1 Uncharacterised protein [Klebsiella pneumoniae]